MKAKKLICIAAIASALSGAAVAYDNDYRDDWSWGSHDEKYGWDDDWEEELVQIPEQGRSARSQQVSFVAKVVTANRTREWVKVVAGGQILTWLAPMEKRTLVLDSNVGSIKAVVGDRVIGTQSVKKGRRKAQSFRIDTPRTGMVKIKNTLRYPVRVKLNGRIIGRLSPNSSEQFEIATGYQRIELEAVNSRGQTRLVGRKRIEVEAFEADTLVTPEMRSSNRSRRHRRSRSRHEGHSSLY